MGFKNEVAQYTDVYAGSEETAYINDQGWTLLFYPTEDTVRVINWRLSKDITLPLNKNVLKHIIKFIEHS